MHIEGLLIALVAFFACGSASDSSVCNGLSAYDYPRTDSCWRYRRCSSGSETPQDSWCFPLLRRFSRVDFKCEWFWEVDCGKQPISPPSPTLTPPPTAAPTTGPPSQIASQEPTAAPPPTGPPSHIASQEPTAAPPTTGPPSPIASQEPTAAPPTTGPPSPIASQGPTAAPPTTGPRSHIASQGPTEPTEQSTELPVKPTTNNLPSKSPTRTTTEKSLVHKIWDNIRGRVPHHQPS